LIIGKEKLSEIYSFSFWKDNTIKYNFIIQANVSAITVEGIEFITVELKSDCFQYILFFKVDQNIPIYFNYNSSGSLPSYHSRSSPQTAARSSQQCDYQQLQIPSPRAEPISQTEASSCTKRKKR